MKEFQIYLNMDVKYSSSCVTIFADTVEEIDSVSVLVDGKILINFNNEILSCSVLAKSL